MLNKILISTAAIMATSAMAKYTYELKEDEFVEAYFTNKVDHFPTTETTNDIP